MRILEGRRRRVEERREGLRAAMSRAAERLDPYTLQLHQLGVEASDREVRWLNELIATEQAGQDRGSVPAARPGLTHPSTRAAHRATPATRRSAEPPTTPRHRATGSTTDPPQPA